jgi:thiaminase/transcriptional activator TenA
MNWNENAWQRALPIIEGIKALPFITELINGTLDKEKFKFYIGQDSIYLDHFGRALALIAGRAGQLNHVLDFIRFAEGAIVVENALHADYFRAFEITTQPEISPGCHHYTNFLLKEAALSQVEVAMAAVLPCFWIYKYIGDFIFSQQTMSDNPYQTWIATYAGEDFGVVVEKAITICEQAANTCTEAQKEKMTEAFICACEMEWIFWDDAYRRKRWPITQAK